MADRVLRGSRLGSTSYEADRNHDLAPRRTATYRCPRDHEFAVPMADDAEVPAVWDCRMHGLSSMLSSAVSLPSPARTALPRRRVPLRDTNRLLFDLLLDATYPWDTLRQKHKDLAIEILARLIVQAALGSKEKGNSHD